ncbi:hypothetical protein JXA85_06820 [Candidatus Woesearchaeota archaeon]|nr:hypothetical protein [Candidatus Woesearchaeota archaeon]
MQLSKLEAEAYETLRKNNLTIFKTNDLRLLMGFNAVKTYNLIKTLKKKAAIITKKAGTYALRGTNELAIGSYLNWPSYLSFWSALNYYGFSDQLPKTIFYATTRYRKKTGNFKYVTLSRRRFFGYVRAGDIIIAEKEKAVVDSLLFPKYAGGLRELTESVRNSIDRLDRKKLIEYCKRIKNKAAMERLEMILNDKHR